MTESNYPKYIAVGTDGDPSIPPLIDGKLPVDIASVSVTLSDANITVTNTIEDPIPTKSYTVISTVNSTATPINANIAFTGNGEDVSNYGVISIAVFSNVASASNGIEFQFSPDNTNWYVSDYYTYASFGVVKNYSLAPVARYFRIKYTNGGTNQTTFFVETTYRQVYVKSSSHRVLDAVSKEDDAEVVQAVLVARNNADVFADIRATNGGNLKVSIEETNGATDFATETTLSAIDTKIPALGQALAAASVPVVLTASQLSALTPVSTVTANAGTNLNTSLLALESGGNLASIKNQLITTAPYATSGNQELIIAQLDTYLPSNLTVTNTRLLVDINSTPVTHTETQLTAPGTTTARQADTANFSKITFVLTIANINTSVTVKAEGSIDNTNWFNLDVNETTTTYTANGTYALLFDRRLPYVRFNFVSESGGTSATIDVKVYLA